MGVASIIILVVGTIFNAGIVYAGFNGMRQEVKNSRSWQQSHEEKDNRRFLLTVGAIAALANERQQTAITDLLKGAAGL